LILGQKRVAGRWPKPCAGRSPARWMTCERRRMGPSAPPLPKSIPGVRLGTRSLPERKHPKGLGMRSKRQ
jgi:hypothetical protein